MISNFFRYIQIGNNIWSWCQWTSLMWKVDTRQTWRCQISSKESLVTGTSLNYIQLIIFSSGGQSTSCLQYWGSVRWSGWTHRVGQIGAFELPLKLVTEYLNSSYLQFYSTATHTPWIWIESSVGFTWRVAILSSKTIQDSQLLQIGFKITLELQSGWNIGVCGPEATLQKVALDHRLLLGTVVNFGEPNGC